jgi:hypothetical protein
MSFHELCGNDGVELVHPFDGSDQTAICHTDTPVRATVIIFNYNVRLKLESINQVVFLVINWT